MGRALFSLAYTAAAPIIRTEPEPKVDVCETWNVWNPFDPDSEDFFQDAEYEAFIDPAQLVHEQVELSAEMAALAAAEGNSDTSESTDSGVSDQGSPMAVGSDDPAILIADAYTNRARWEDSDDMEVGSPTETEWRPTSADSNTIYTSANISPFLISRSPPMDGVPAFIPPTSFRDTSPGIERESSHPSDSPRSPILRRTVNITPISISRTTVDSVAWSPPANPPSTPPPHITYRQQVQSLATPSPPPSVTPRFYSLQRHAIPALPTSPSFVRGTRDGPLTNPRARMSFARIDSSPVPVRIPSTVM